MTEGYTIGEGGKLGWDFPDPACFLHNDTLVGKGLFKLLRNLILLGSARWKGEGHLPFPPHHFPKLKLPQEGVIYISLVLSKKPVFATAA